jgi:hypothetical protein
MRFSFFVLVEWFGVDMEHDRVYLRIVFPPQLTNQVFMSFKDCVGFLIDPSQKLQVNLHECWLAFSHETILPILQSYFQTFNTTLWTDMAQQRAYPLKELFDALKSTQPPPFYCFKVSTKHQYVAKIDSFLQSAQTPKRVQAQSLAHIDTTTPITATTSASLNPLVWTDNEWADKSVVAEYFANVRHRLHTKFQFDPPLRDIRGWTPQKNGGWDMTFLCGVVSANGGYVACWIHYLQLQINPLYKSMLDEFVHNTPKIIEHVRLTTTT